MPITGPSSYLPCTAEFFAHWEEVNEALGDSGALKLETNQDIAEFTNARTGLLGLRDELEEGDVDMSLARAALEEAKEVLLLKINLFNTMVRGTMGTSVYGRVLPAVPGIGEGQEGFSKPMKQAAKLWTKINATPPPGVTAPVLLVDGTTQPEFAALVAELAGLYDEVVWAEGDISLLLKQRDDAQDVLYTMMKLYRQAVPTRFMPGNAFLDSMPALTPSGGRTPDAVSLAGAWVPAQSAAQLTAGVSGDPELKEYELRWCAGGNYSQDTEHVAGTIPAGSPPVFVTTKGLLTDGAVASFRVYVRLLSGGEAGSETVVVERP